jgi:hypothetical protein
MSRMSKADYQKIWDYRSSVTPSLLNAIRNELPISIRGYKSKSVRGVSVENCYKNLKVEHITVDSYLLDTFNMIMVTYSYYVNNEKKFLNSKCNAITGKFMGEFAVPLWALTWY